MEGFNIRQMDRTGTVGCIHLGVRKCRMQSPCILLGQQKKEFERKVGMVTRAMLRQRRVYNLVGGTRDPFRKAGCVVSCHLCIAHSCFWSIFAVGGVGYGLLPIFRPCGFSGVSLRWGLRRH